MELDHVLIRGAREHNLRGIDVRIPKKKLVVLTGVSGSGKSSLAFDTLYAEGQRRYVESLSAYARQFLGQMEKPRYDTIRGLSPTISIEQKTTGTNPRSTVGTITEIADYLRVLYARVGTQHCHRCGKTVQGQTAQQIAREILSAPEGSKLVILAPLLVNRKGEHRELLAEARRAGFARLRVDGEIVAAEDVEALDKRRKHTVEAVLDRLVVRKGLTSRVTDSVETALRVGAGMLIAATPDAGDRVFSENMACAACGLSFPELTPQSFSFNSPQGMCVECNGLGSRVEIDPELVVPDESLSLDGGAIKPWGPEVSTKTGWVHGFRGQICQKLGIEMNRPWRKLPKRQRELLLWGAGERVFRVRWSGKSGQGTLDMRWEGVIPRLTRRFKQTGSERAKRWYARFIGDARCHGLRGRAPAARERRRARRRKHDRRGLGPHGGRGPALLPGAPAPRRRAPDRGRGAEGDPRASRLPRRGGPRLPLARPRGPHALGRRIPADPAGEPGGLRAHGRDLHPRRALDRPAPARQPAAARHARAHARHRQHGGGGRARRGDDPERGPRDRLRARGRRGGRAHRPRRNAEEPRAEPTLADGRLPLRPPGDPGAGAPAARHREPEDRRRPREQPRDLDVEFPLGVLTAVTGVSGAGKSTLVNDVISPALARRYHGSTRRVGRHRAIFGFDQLDKVISIDQKPIGRTPRSNPATYIKVFDEIRRCFAQLPEARMHGYKPGRFSFNVKGGRCEACRGDGVRRIEMHFLPDVYVRCEECAGRRFNDATLRVLYKGRSIADVLDLTVREAIELFSAHPRILGPLQLLADVGLDYLHLGQPSPTLSGGEAQRIKLARELAKRATGRTLYILDEPTTGLHFDDVRKLLDVLDRMVEAGNTVIVIEHNLDVVKTADWIIDLGPEGGPGGGRLVAQGPPETVARQKGSHTGRHLKPLLRRRSP